MMQSDVGKDGLGKMANKGRSTQMSLARDGVVTEQMTFVAEKEGISVDELRGKIAEGKIVIPANVNHIKQGLKPIGVGAGLEVKVNVNLGASPEDCSLEEELKKVDICVEYHADTLMDLSVAGDLDAYREAIIAHCDIPVGTVPLYQVAVEQDILNMTKEHILQVILKQAKQGVDFMTIHSGFKKEFLPLVDKRLMGTVSRGGGFLNKWMRKHNQENPLYEMYDEILDICAEYDVTLSLGDSLRPGALADSGDEAQIAELKTLGELTLRAWDKNVQVMVEGPGHVPLNKIKEQMELEKEYCHGAPFYVLGPLTTDIGAGYDHITGAIGGAVAGMYGADMLCYVTPAEHLKLPDIDDVREGLMAFKIAAHSADIARGNKKAWARDREMSVYRKSLDWGNQARLSLDKKKFIEYRKKSGVDHKACTMCGKFCPMRED